MALAARQHGLASPSATRRAAALAACCILIAGLSGPVSAQEAPTPEIFGDWEYACGEDGAACTLSQANVEKDTDRVRMRSEISILPDDRILLSVTLPQNLLLTEGPWLTVDGLYIGPLTYVTCGEGCIARATFTPPQFGLLAQGNRAIITVITSSGQRLGVAMSLAGLTKGYERLATP